MLDWGTRIGFLLGFFIAAGGLFAIIVALVVVIAVREKKLIHYLHAGFRNNFV